MTETKTVMCARCGKEKEAFERAPFPGAIGARVLDGTCKDCWAEWLKQQTMLINHYGLNVMDPQARQFLTRNMEAFLFRHGQQDDVDTTKLGTITH
jgi:Fe-S cluster biosynthesis and repair protein YggX